MISRRVFTAAAIGSLGHLMGAERSRILVHGHRGARARRPENTLPAFRYAIEQGVDVLELDVAVTKDGIAVVSHDPLINATICSGPKTGIAIHTLTLAQLHEYDCGGKQNPNFPTQVPVPGTRVPTLDEVFDLGRGNQVWFNVETKIFADKPELTPDPEDFTKLILDLIRKHGLEKRVILQSFDPRTLRVMKKLDPAMPRAALFETGRDWPEVAKEFEATIFSPEFHLVTAERVAKAHAAGLQVVPWTVDKPEDWQRMADAKVDAIISDDPASLIAWLKGKGLR
ncbi:MAG TPA: glycerophosphodiester phosphodiesterase [Bryobacteraceae bacterium]|jgi:glycerophosphoryl diester phosphodiesterase|nr:glycerophosphodiester phosphodiesterase [Bryobacteraceae bacterium]